MPDYKDYKRSPDYMYQNYEGYGGDEHVDITVFVTDYTTGESVMLVYVYVYV